jgi:hypothetical protein
VTGRSFTASGGVNSGYSGALAGEGGRLPSRKGGGSTGCSSALTVDTAWSDGGGGSDDSYCDGSTTFGSEAGGDLIGDGSTGS